MSSLTRPSHYATSPYPPYGGSSSSSTTYAAGALGGTAAALKTQTTKGSSGGASRPVKEEEVDALTDLLVQSMDNAADPEFFGQYYYFLFNNSLVICLHTSFPFPSMAPLKELPLVLMDYHCVFLCASTRSTTSRRITNSVKDAQ